MFNIRRIYILADTHGFFSGMEDFCGENHTTKEDVAIILGDSGINSNGDEFKDQFKKIFLESLPITIFAVHGNHEKRASQILTYKEKLFCGGVVYYEEQYPGILFAKDGEIYDFHGNKTIVIGGAYSVDKFYRVSHGLPWFADEQPSREIKDYVEAQLEKHNWKVDIVLSHTGPLKYEPTEYFMEGVNQGMVDKSTEEWLDQIEDQLDYKRWYLGHYHCDKKIDKVQILFEIIERLDLKDSIEALYDKHQPILKRLEEDD